jgi:hypothetical protein
MPVQKSRRPSFLPCQARSQSTNSAICVGRRSSLSHHRRQVAHTDLASTQPRRRCVMVSWPWSQNGQARRYGNPRRSSLSTV